LKSISECGASELQAIQLPPPQILQGKTLMQAISERKTSREFASQNIHPQMLSNLLWAALGINRPESGRRTAHSVLNKQEIHIYVVTNAGQKVGYPLSKSLGHSLPKK
jgi:Nitroreductase family